MTQIELEAQAVEQIAHVDLGRSYALHLPRGPRSNADLYHKGGFIKRANLHDKNELRLFAVELMQRGLSQTRLAEVLSLSRQTLHNYRESYREFGVEGLLHGYSPAKSKDKELHRRINVSKRRPGSKALELQALRRQRKAQASPDAKQDELAWDGSAQTIYELQEPDIEGALRTQRTPSKRAPKTVSQAVPDAVAASTASPSNPMALSSAEQTLASEQATPAPSSVPAVIPAESQVPAPTRAIAVDTEATATVTPDVPIALALAPTPVPEAAARQTSDTAQSATTLPPAEGAAQSAQPTPTAPSASTVLSEKVSVVPYAANHAWEVNRHAGVFTLLMVLIGQSQWLLRLFRLFGNGWRIFLVFAFMAAANIRSIEQLKHERRDELGHLLGLGRLPGLDTVWSWFYEVAGKQRGTVLLKEFFAEQIRFGIVGLRLWFTDGHLLPYSGQDKVHAAWNTQRNMPVPGQTNLVTCDESGRVVCFDIQEGHGDLRGRILKLGRYAREQGLGALPPLHVFDREGDGLPFFSALVRSSTPFVTWEKNARQDQLMALAESDFSAVVKINGTQYRLFEQVRVCRYKPSVESALMPSQPQSSESEPQALALPESQASSQASSQPGQPSESEPQSEHRFELRRVVLWDQGTNRRISVLCWDGPLKLSAPEVASAMLMRWGASENTFKHIQARHPYHYHPGFGVTHSDKQDIANPAIKAIERQASRLQDALAKLYKQHAKAKPSLKKDGSERMNSQYRRIGGEIAVQQEQLKSLKANKAKLPERVDVSSLADYRSFKAIDNEGKNLFDFVTSSVWNVRRQMLDWLQESYARDNDRVDLLYAILNCQGWIYSDDQKVVVRMEPLQQPARRYAQEQLCRKLTGLGARIPAGKWLHIEVGESPL